MSWVSGQFTTRVIALIPVAIAINIVIGYIAQNVLKLPIYLDSIGTILVGVLAGPLAGALTGALSNIIWALGAQRRHDLLVLDHGRRDRPAGRASGATSASTGRGRRPGGSSPRPRIVAAILVLVIIVPILTTPPTRDPNIGGYPSWVYAAAGSIGVIVALVVAALHLSPTRPCRACSSRWPGSSPASWRPSSPHRSRPSSTAA